jgi:CO/xanthine dehydrogenase FAD-binding subunit
VRADSAEKQLRGATLDGPAILAAAAEAVRGLRPTPDLHGGTEYRVRLLRTMTERALTKAAQRAKRST